VYLSAAPSAEVSRTWQLCHSESFNSGTSYVLSILAPCQSQPCLPIALRAMLRHLRSPSICSQRTGAYLLRQAWPKTCWRASFPAAANFTTRLVLLSYLPIR
jgi:hypothetical protein